MMGKLSKFPLTLLLLPLLLLFVGSFVVLSSEALVQTSKAALLLKLLLGLVLLGVPSYYLRFALVPQAVRILPQKIDWLLMLLAVALGPFLFYSYLWLYKEVFNSPTAVKFLSYYGDFSVHDSLFVPIVLVLGAYVLAEELYFRGLVYGYLKTIGGVWLGAGVAAAFFAFAHLSLLLPYLILLVVLSLIAAGFLETTGVLLYGFVTHAMLDYIALMANMPPLYRYIYPNTTLYALVLTGLVLLLTLFIIVRRMRVQ